MAFAVKFLIQQCYNVIINRLNFRLMYVVMKCQVNESKQKHLICYNCDVFVENYK